MKGVVWNRNMLNARSIDSSFRSRISLSLMCFTFSAKEASHAYSFSTCGNMKHRDGKCNALTDATSHYATTAIIPFSLSVSQWFSMCLP